MMKTAMLAALLAAPVLSQQTAITNVENLGGGCRTMSGGAFQVAKPAVIGKVTQFVWRTPSVPSLGAWLAFGVADPQLQVEAGCTIHVMPVVILPVRPTASALSLMVPNDNVLVGAKVIVQMAVAAPIIPMDVSDAYRMTIGN